MPPKIAYGFRVGNDFVEPSSQVVITIELGPNAGDASIFGTIRARKLSYCLTATAWSHWSWPCSHVFGTITFRSLTRPAASAASRIDVSRPVVEPAARTCVAHDALVCVCVQLPFGPTTLPKKTAGLWIHVQRFDDDAAP